MSVEVEQCSSVPEEPERPVAKDAALGTSQVSRDAAEVPQEPSQPSVPALWHQERLGVQVVVLCLGFGLYTSQGRGVSEEAGSQLDLAQLKRWLNSRCGDRLPEIWEAAMPAPPGWMTLAIITVMLWAFWEATKFPRHATTQNVWGCMRMLMQLLGDLALAPLFLLLPGELTEVLYQATPQNEHILASCSSMWRFKQTPWLRNAWLCFAALMYYDLTGNDESMVHREKLSTPDGGVIALDWWGSSQPGANGKTKVLFVGTTWSGDAMVSFAKEVCKHFTAEGWQCVVMVKRGCGLTMPNKQPPPEPGMQASPWCLSGFDDFQLAVDHVVDLCPGVPVCGLGTSLGGGQLRNYVNETGSQSRLTAAVVVDAGEDWELALTSLDRRLPIVASALKMAGDSTCDMCGVPAKTATMVDDSRAEANAPASTISNLVSKVFRASPQKSRPAEGPCIKFVRQRLAPFHGFEASAAGASHYMRSCQPADPVGCNIPTLEMITFNDLLTEASEIQKLQKLYLASPHIVTCTTRLGTHIVRWSGIRGSCWISQVGCEFLESALRAPPTQRAEPATNGPRD